MVLNLYYLWFLMIKLSKLTDYAVVVLVDLAQHAAALQSASVIAARTSLPEPTVSKILKILARHDIVRSIRGAQGGYRLEESPDCIAVKDVIEAIDGPIALTSCVSQADNTCAVERQCVVSGRWNKVNDAVTSALAKITLVDMMPHEAGSAVTATTEQLFMNEKTQEART